ncbi:MAG: SusC/RagA family TonB-linked outer membrane protein [Candidatus Pseudobacter hemicellulosilyticus]|uniref:SusC/RagA family TonB-linked outer membrane protein n=1 Tax=Candidatus Pseudobacter hemicellulosilyticus TaxID=3121375 RepID=A0AAJ5WRX4_9BACT|nr:MAG: SusC/RagA family TonB-linked outer membrane protein [Pseudobacter sp.]
MKKFVNSILFLLILISLQASGNASRQEITISVKDKPLLTVIGTIQKKTALRFFYPMDVIKYKSKPVTLTFSGNVFTLLDKIFSQQPGIEYIQKEKYIVIRERIVAAPQLFNNMLEVRDNPIDVTGRVINENGDPVVGATIQVRGTTIATATNGDGVFQLRQIAANATILITAVNILPTERPVKGQKNMLVEVKGKTGKLDEVQIIAYGTTTRRLNTSNSVTITAKDIEKQPVTNPLLSLQGRVPGLFVLQPSGLAGSSVKVQVQGINSITSGNNPLYVIDGVPIISELPSTVIDAVLGPAGPNYSGNGNPLNYINIADIESIDVLKDADATAIYGSRAANGAILITTKKGKVGQMQLNVNMQTGWGQVGQKLDMLNTRQYLDMRYEAFRNDGINWKSPSIAADDLKVWDTTRYTDWQEELIGNTSRLSNISANVSGGNSTVRYLFGATYHKETTVFPIPSDFSNEKIGANASITANSTDNRFRFQFSGNYMFDRNQLPGFDLTQEALLLEPNAPSLLNADGTLNWAPNAAGASTFYGNPMRKVLVKYRNNTYNLISNVVAGYKLFPFLELSSSFGYNSMRTNDIRALPLILEIPENRANSLRAADYGTRNIDSWIIEPQLKFNTDISKGRMELLFGGTILNLKTTAGYLYGTGHLNDELLENVDAAATLTSQYALQSEYKYNALFGRLNYNWEDKYLINISLRRDGSSRFGGANRLHNFYSIGAGWIFSNESFFNDNIDFISFGKLKGSYGTTGNDQIGDYRFLSLYNFPTIEIPYQGVVSLMPAGLPNPHLQWEETKKLQVGMELGFLKDNILLNVFYVRNRSSNQLLDYNLPAIAGFTSYLVNFPAVVQNRNWEFSVNSRNLQHNNFSWRSNFNLTIPQNELLSFPELSASTYANLLVVGHPLTVSKSYRFSRVDPASGKYQFLTSKGEGTNTPNPSTDLTALVNKLPKFYGGFQNTLTYKGIQLDFLFQFVKQMGYNDALFWNGSRLPGSFYGGLSNQSVSVLDRWQKIGDKKPIEKFTTSNNFFAEVISSDYRFTDASFIRLKNVALSWELPVAWLRKAGFKKANLYVHAQNLFTITSYSGLDPETQSMISLPPLRIVTVGTQLSL